jgi:hypothetical protein
MTIFYIIELMKKMQIFQAPLLADSVLDQRTVCVEWITATLTQYSQSDFEVLLEINSNKILVAFQWAIDRIEELQILAVKW